MTFKGKAQDTEADKNAMYDNARARLPVQKVGEPEDVAHSILFLMTNSFSTGTVVMLDGGANLL